MAIAAPDPRLLHIFIFLLLLSAINSDIAAAAGAPAPSSSPASPAPLDPKQVRALESLNIPIFKDPCSPPPRSSAPPTITCDSAKPYRHVLSLTLVNCSGHLPLSRSVLESLSTLTSLNFVNCHISLVRLPPELASNLHSFTCINSLKKLTGVWLNRLQNLTDLTVSRSSITASGPAIVIGGKKSLHTVTLSQTNLSGALPRHWHPDLTFVDMSRNHLEGRIPFSLTRLGKLAHLNLSSNSLNGTLPSTIGYLTALQNFSLASNSLSGPIPKSLGSLTSLRHLDLSNNQLNGAVPDFIGDMKKLKYLNLENNNFRGVLPFNPTFVKRLAVFKVGENSNLCYNHSTFTSKVKLGIAPCDKHGKPMSPPPAKDDSSDGSLGSDTGTVEKKHHSGPSKVVLGFAIVISSIVFLIIFLVILIKCCR